MTCLHLLGIFITASSSDHISEPKALSLHWNWIYFEQPLSNFNRNFGSSSNLELNFEQISDKCGIRNEGLECLPQVANCIYRFTLIIAYIGVMMLSP